MAHNPECSLIREVGDIYGMQYVCMCQMRVRRRTSGQRGVARPDMMLSPHPQVLVTFACHR